MLAVFSVGNPGPATRHSTGHQVLDRVRVEMGVPQMVRERRGGFSYAAANGVAVVHSDRYMNESGAAMAAWVALERRLVGSSSLVLVVYDDFELAAGTVRLLHRKNKESHNGLKDINNRCPELRYLRLGVGVGPKPHGDRDTIARWVLAKASAAERAAVESTLPRVYAVVRALAEAAAAGTPADDIAVARVG